VRVNVYVRVYTYVCVCFCVRTRTMISLGSSLAFTAALGLVHFFLAATFTLWFGEECLCVGLLVRHACTQGRAQGSSCSSQAQHAAHLFLCDRLPQKK
jgi:hypothetical protein